METHFIIIFLGAIFTHNLALTYILGMCPFIGLSNNIKTAAGMSGAVVFVITLTAVLNWPIYHFLLIPFKSEFISFIVFIIVIAGSVQLMEMIIERFYPKLQASFGIFLPLITVNCIVLSVSIFVIIRNYNFLETFFFALGSSLGWSLALLIVTGIKEKMDLDSDVPYGLKGAGITMIIASVLAMAFLGFTGMLKIQ